MSVFLNLFGEDVNGFDDTSYVLHIDIFGLMAFTNYVLPEVDLFENLWCNWGGPLYTWFNIIVYCYITVSLRRYCRNLLSIDSQLNQIDPSQTISPAKYRIGNQNQIRNTAWRSISI